MIKEMLEKVKIIETIKNIKELEPYQEVLIKFADTMFPHFGNVVILAGGAGSGKGFVLSNLLGIEGKILDVDKLKELAISAPLIRKQIQEIIKEKTGKEINFNDKNILKNPEMVRALHFAIEELKIKDKWLQTFYKSVLLAPKDRKPNIIFDVTLKSFSKFYNITKDLEMLGYDKKNIHLTWVLQHIEVAKELNKQRPRVVPEEILIDTHEGASYTMKKLISMGKKLRQYMDGYMYLIFNQPKVDTKVVKEGFYIKDAFYVLLKERGKNPISPKELGEKIINKIKEYVPNPEIW